MLPLSVFWSAVSTMAVNSALLGTSLPLFLTVFYIYFLMCWKSWSLRLKQKGPEMFYMVSSEICWRFFCFCLMKICLSQVNKWKKIYFYQLKKILDALVFCYKPLQKKKKSNSQWQILYIWVMFVFQQGFWIFIYLFLTFLQFVLFNAATMWKQGELNIALCYNVIHHSFTTNHEIWHPLWKYKIHIT